MKLTPRSEKILQNFASISDSARFSEGAKQKIIAPNKTIIAYANLDIEFPQDFALISISRLLGIMSMFNEPELDFQEKYLSIEEGTRSIKYVYAEPAVIMEAPNLDVKDEAISFDISETDIKQALKAASVMQVPNISFVGEGGKLCLIAHDTKNDTSDEYRLDIGKVSKGVSFNFDYKVENFKMLEEPYKVVVGKNKLTKYVGKDVTYLMAAESTSKYNG